MPAPYLLAIDNGTQSVRALLFDLQGNLVDKAQVAITYQSPEPGWMECGRRSVLASTCARPASNCGKPPASAKSDIAGLVITTQRGTTVALDEARPALAPRDDLARPAPRRPRPAPGLVVGGGVSRPLACAARCATSRKRPRPTGSPSTSPRLWARTAHVFAALGLPELPLHRSLCRFGGRRRWATCRSTTKRATGHRRTTGSGRRCPSRPPCCPSWWRRAPSSAKVSEQAAQDTGIPAGLPVLAGAADKACEVLGAGCLTPEIACLSYGTAATINTTTPRYLEATPFIPPYQAAVPGHYNTEVQITRGFWMVNWFKEQFGLHEQQQADARRRDAREPVRRAGGPQSATRRPGPHAAALLEPRHQGARPRGQGRQ
jgi:hypothetical protein